MLDGLVANQADIGQLLSLDRFLTFLDLLKKDAANVEAVRRLLEAFARHRAQSNDPALCHHVLSVHLVIVF